MRERANPFLRGIDRYLGIPVVFLCGIFRRKRAFEKGEKIALLATAGIGDTVLLSALIADLKGKQVTLFTGSTNREMGELIGGIEVVPLPITQPWKAVRLLRKTSFDVWIDTNPWPRINALFSLFAKATFKVGFRTPGQYRHWGYDAPIDHLTSRHELENLRALLAPLKIPATHLPHIKATPPLLLNTPAVALHLFAGGSRAHLKEWPEENWIALINALLKKNCTLFLTGSRADKTRLSRIQQGSLSPHKIQVVAGLLSLKETAQLLHSVTATISVDTGIMHLAAAVDSPLISLHGPTSPYRWGAIGKKVIPLQQKRGYQPCIQLGFETVCSSNRCMRGIEVSSVLKALSTLIKTS